MKVRETGEHYLKCIFSLERGTGPATLEMVASELGFSLPAVERAVAVLQANGQVEMSGEAVRLTESGRAAAVRIEGRCRLLERLLAGVGVDPETAATDARRIEPILSQKAFRCLEAHLSPVRRQHTRP